VNVRVAIAVFALNIDTQYRAAGTKTHLCRRAFAIFSNHHDCQSELICAEERPK